ncbi:hypothetical protein BKA57DRAFT_225434 [Linnemannia elongata]|nr:hypothetical protein BKA57DRAFT_225434 [Linnemannia elongata]
MYTSVENILFFCFDLFAFDSFMFFKLCSLPSRKSERERERGRQEASSSSPFASPSSSAPILCSSKYHSSKYPYMNHPSSAAYSSLPLSLSLSLSLHISVTPPFHRTSVDLALFFFPVSLSVSDSVVHDSVLLVLPLFFSFSLYHPLRLHPFRLFFFFFFFFLCIFFYFSPFPSFSCHFLFSSSSLLLPFPFPSFLSSSLLPLPHSPSPSLFSSSPRLLFPFNSLSFTPPSSSPPSALICFLITLPSSIPSPR